MTSLNRSALDDRALWATTLRLSRMPGGVWLSTLARSGWFDEVAQILTADNPRTAVDVVLGHTMYPTKEAEQLVQTWTENLTSIGGLDSGLDDLDHMLELNARLLTCADQEWPSGLASAQGELAPCALWVMGMGRLDEAVERSVTVTGARACTAYGEVTTSQLAHGLITAGVGVVSSGGYGIDTAAHRSALMTQDQGSAPRTVAVMASGLDQLYPRGNAMLLAKLAEENLVISAEAPRTVPSRTRFNHRVHPLTALSQATVVVEAGQISGSIRVARLARHFGCPVGAVPGPVTSATSVGTNRLIQDGVAQLVTDAADVLNLLAEPDQTN